jgi:aryl-alcohol dehydrogenase-like predicted oxidoreductase
VIPYFALAAGFLTGKYRGKEHAAKAARGKMVEKYLNDWGLGVVRVLEEIAKAQKSTPSRVALAWLIAQPGVTAPIASATDAEHLTDLVEATKLMLDTATIEKLNAVSAPQTLAKA